MRYASSKLDGRTRQVLDYHIRSARENLEKLMWHVTRFSTWTSYVVDVVPSSVSSDNETFELLKSAGDKAAKIWNTLWNVSKLLREIEEEIEQVGGIQKDIEK